jgi:hypothetical protein
MVSPGSESTLIEVGESPPRATTSQLEPRPAEPGVAAAGEDENEAEVARLEGLLAVRAREIVLQRTERTRLERLLREAATRFETAPVTGAAAADTVELTRQRDVAMARALEAEAARAEMSLRIDELMGHWAHRSNEDRPGEALDVTCARLAGTVRGQQLALAEAEEGRDVAEARLLLLEQDLEQRHRQSRVLERELHEARELAELELVRTRGLTAELEGALRAPHAAELKGELAGLRARLLEAERAAEHAAKTLQANQHERSVLRADLDAHNRKIGELHRTLERETKTETEIANQLARAAAETIALRDELERARAHAAELERALAAERGLAQRDANDQRGQAEQLARSLREVRRALYELPSSLAQVTQTSSMASVERAEGMPSDAPTQPGIPLYLEGLEGLEEQVTLRDRRIVELSDQLARERGRLTAVTRVLRQLSEEADATWLSRVNDLLATLTGS